MHILLSETERNESSLAGRILVVKVVPNPEEPGTLLFGASSLRALGNTHLRKKRENVLYFLTTPPHTPL